MSRPRGYKHTPETIAKISATKKAQGEMHPSKRPEVRAKISASSKSGRSVAGCPISADIAAPALRLIIQVDGCYWHECPEHGSGRFPNKRAHDLRLTAHTEAHGWHVLRFWEHEVNSDISAVIRTILAKAATLRS